MICVCGGAGGWCFGVDYFVFEKQNGWDVDHDKKIDTSFMTNGDEHIKHEKNHH